MAYETIIFEKKDDVGLITFNRPKALNALSPDVLRELDEVLEAITVDPEVRAVVVTGAGDKAFVAGADIKAMSTFSPLMAKRFSAAGQKTISKLAAIPQPVIACVNGFALGGGLEVALACDFIYAAETAKFGQPEISLGIIPGFGGTQRLSRRVGLGLAKEMCLTGVMIDAAEAKAIGLVNKLFPPEELMEATMQTAKLLASKGRLALREIKTVMEDGFDLDLIKACAMEVDRFTICFTSEDREEGLSAFIEKRKPDFKGGL